MSNAFSELTEIKVLSPNYNERGNNEVYIITPHCTDGQLSYQGARSCFGAGKNVSCNYLIDKDAKICGVVEEFNRSWCTSSRVNDFNAITIEIASDRGEPCAMSNAVIEKFKTLVIDICKRYGKNKVVWFKTHKEFENHKRNNNEMLISYHLWFDANRSCPGKYFLANADKIFTEINTKLNGSTPAQHGTSEKLYRVQVGAYKEKANAEKFVEYLSKMGVSAIIKYE